MHKKHKSRSRYLYKGGKYGVLSISIFMFWYSTTYALQTLYSELHTLYFVLHTPYFVLWSPEFCIPNLIFLFQSSACMFPFTIFKRQWLESWLQQIEFRKKNPENRIQKMKFRKWNSENRIQRLKFEKWNSENRIWKSEFRNQHIGCSILCLIQGLEDH